MPLTYEHAGSKKPAKINTYMLTRAALLITLCYEIPCKREKFEHIGEAIFVIPFMRQSHAETLKKILGAL